MANACLSRKRKGAWARVLRCPGTRNVALSAAGLTPQSLRRQLPFQGRQGKVNLPSPSAIVFLSRMPRLRRGLAHTFPESKVVRERRKVYAEYRRDALRGSWRAWGMMQRCPGTRNVALSAAGLTPQSLRRQLPFQGSQGRFKWLYLCIVTCTFALSGFTSVLPHACPL